MTRVKICSISDVSHALAAAEAGADYVGLNFVPGVRRQLAEAKAKDIVTGCREAWGSGGPKLVGIFVDQPLAEVNRILEACGLDMAQLSGNETTDYVRGLVRPAIKAVHVPVGRPVDEVVHEFGGTLLEYERVGAIPLLDPEVTGHHGGAGQTFDWAIARELASRHKFLLAGGLTPENVAQAVAQVQPWGVDVSSGVEMGGVKDSAKIKAFVAAARYPSDGVSLPIRLLFVCGGNTCRSPMAAALARRVLGDSVLVSSAGVDVREQSAMNDAVEALKDLYGVDISGHIPTDVNEYRLAEYDVVVAMTPGIADRLGDYYLVPAEKLVVWSVSDPYLRGRAAYEQCVRQLAGLIDDLILERALPRRAP